MLCSVWQPIGYPRTGLAVLFPRSFARHQWGVVFSHGGDDRSKARGKWFSGEIDQLWLWVEKIDVAGATFHKQEDDALGFGEMMWFGASRDFRSVHAVG